MNQAEETYSKLANNFALKIAQLEAEKAILQVENKRLQEQLQQYEKGEK